jgi:hypothetical protein
MTMNNAAASLGGDPQKSQIGSFYRTNRAWTNDLDELHCPSNSADYTPALAVSERWMLRFQQLRTDEILPGRAFRSVYERTVETRSA